MPCLPQVPVRLILEAVQHRPKEARKPELFLPQEVLSSRPALQEVVLP